MKQYNTSQVIHPLSKATINELYNATLIEVHIQEKQKTAQVLAVIFLFFFGVGIYTIYQAYDIIRNLPIGFAIIFLIFFMVYFSVLTLIILAIRYLYQSKELLEINAYECITTTPALLRNIINKYQTSKISNIVFVYDPLTNYGKYSKQSQDQTPKGTIRFEYESTTITFGLGLPESEAKYIIQYCIRKKYLTENQLGIEKLS